MAETEQLHRISMDEKTTKNIIAMSYLGIIFAFSSVILLSLLVYYALSKEFNTTAGVIAVGTMASVVGVFMFFRRSRKNN